MSTDKSFWSSLPGILTALAGVIGAVATLVGALYTAGVIGHYGKKPATEVQPRQDAAAKQESPAKDAPATLRLRSGPTTLSSEMINAMLVKYGFYDKARNAGGKGIAHQYDPQAVGDAVVVIDRATGLMWQKTGSSPMTRANAEKYIGGLNAERFAGFNNWRLPTAEEVASLTEPHAQDGFHIGAVFQRGINFIWTADRAPDGRAWVLYFQDGLLAAESTAFNAWVRAVR
jgi:hypothetical protein